jgi:hypothetical protein
MRMDESSQPFDEFGRSEQVGQKAGQNPVPRFTRAVLLGLSFVGLWIAIVTIALVLIGHILPAVMRSAPAIPLKTAVPLIAIGSSYLCLILASRRAFGQRFVGITVGVAFILWGVEQLLKDPTLIAIIDDFVVFFFVVDLAIVVRKNLRAPE